MKKILRPRFCPTWHILDGDGSVLWSLSEAQITTKNVFVSPDASLANQAKLAGLMEVGESAYCRILSPNYSVQAQTHTIYLIKRVA